MEVLDGDEFGVNCEFTVMYESYENTCQVKLVQEHNNKCVDEEMVVELAFKKSK